MLLAIQVAAQTAECDSIVYPGDLNKDGIVNVHDALYWGLTYGETGPVRPNATNEWTSQYCPDWSWEINGVNGKNQDGNGDGMIDTLDLEPIYLNYDSTQTCIIKGEINLSNRLAVYYTEEVIGMELRREYHVVLKNQLYHGCAFTFDYSELDAVIGVGVDTTDSQLEPSALLVVHDAANQRIDIAVTRTDLIDTNSGQALIIVICEDIAALTGDEREVFFSNVKSVESNFTQTIHEDISYKSPPFPPTVMCKQIFDLEHCQYQNGIINIEEAYGGGGSCFEGRMYKEDIAGIPVSCNDEKKLTISHSEYYPDTLWLRIKADSVGWSEAVEVYLSDIHDEYSYAISTGPLDTVYQNIGIATADLLQNSTLDSIEWVYFRKVNDDVDFHIYADEIYINENWNVLWRGDKYRYRNGTLNETEVCAGNYCFEARHDSGGYGLHEVRHLEEPINLSFYDEICFEAKVDQAGQTILFSFVGMYQFPEFYKAVDINDYIEGGSLEVDYQKVCIPLDALKLENCEDIRCKLGYVDRISFSSNDPEIFNFYIDEVRVIRGDAEDCGGCDALINNENPSIEHIQLTAFPNPASEDLNIKISHDKNIRGQLQIIDLQGKIIDDISMNLSSGLNTIPYETNHLQSGMYIVHFTTENGNSGNYKFIKM